MMSNKRVAGGAWRMKYSPVPGLICYPMWFLREVVLSFPMMLFFLRFHFRDTILLCFHSSKRWNPVQHVR